VAPGLRQQQRPNVVQVSLHVPPLVQDGGAGYGGHAPLASSHNPKGLPPAGVQSRAPNLNGRAFPRRPALPPYPVCMSMYSISMDGPTMVALLIEDLTWMEVEPETRNCSAPT
jgi:hypothetical protein